jgi:hypothetical protein
MSRLPSEAAEEFKRRMRAAYDQFGVEANHIPITDEFQDRGINRATIWRWLREVQHDYAHDIGDPTYFMRRNKKKRVRKPKAGPAPVVPPPPKFGRKKRPPPPPPEAEPLVVDDVARDLPAVPTFEDVKTMGLLPVVALLQTSIQAALDLMEHGRMKDGGVRNARLIAAGAEHLRRAVETAAKLNETVAAQQEMQAFHRIIMQEITAESPEVQERILMRVKRACESALSDG